MTIEFTAEAKLAIEKIFSSPEHHNKGGMRVGVRDGGCQGKSYIMDFSRREDNDIVISITNNISVFVSPTSMEELAGTTIDYSDKSKEKGFIFNNPNAEKTCGCGGSFKG